MENSMITKACIGNISSPSLDYLIFNTILKIIKDFSIITT